MKHSSALRSGPTTGLAKAPTGIPGLDEITAGGFPRGRPTLLCGATGCGKSLLAMEFLLRGIEQGEPGVFFAFEETADELAENVRSLGYDLKKLVAKKKLAVDHVFLEAGQIEEAGDYNLEGLFIRLGNAIDRVRARRVALDTLEVLFGSLSNQAILRSELTRLFRWLKGRGVTAVVTAERGEGKLTRHGLEEYVSDCVILLDHRVVDEVATRRLRVVKYRGSEHGTNEYPFLIDENGIDVFPITAANLNYPVTTERVTTGIPALDEMLGGEGLYRGNVVLVSGTAGTGKTSFAAHFAAAACRRKERCLFLAYEEATAQIVRNMRAIGLDLEPWLNRGLLRFSAGRPTQLGLEAHLTAVQRLVREFDPHLVVLDPLTSLGGAGSARAATAVLTRLIDLLKSRQKTLVGTSLTGADAAPETSDAGVSSLIDTWILLRQFESAGERRRAIYILKSRGLHHSSRVREFLLTSEGPRLRDAHEPDARSPRDGRRGASQ
jgi:circadian clock protein KaiC